MSDASHRDISDAPPACAGHFPDNRRRRFLMAFGAGAAGAASVSALASGPAALIAAPPASGTDSQGYRETEHVRNYYATTRI